MVSRISQVFSVSGTKCSTDAWDAADCCSDGASTQTPYDDDSFAAAKIVGMHVLLHVCGPSAHEVGSARRDVFEDIALFVALEGSAAEYFEREWSDEVALGVSFYGDAPDNVVLNMALDESASAAEQRAREQHDSLNTARALDEPSRENKREHAEPDRADSDDAVPQAKWSRVGPSESVGSASEAAYLDGTTVCCDGSDVGGTASRQNSKREHAEPDRADSDVAVPQAKRSRLAL